MIAVIAAVVRRAQRNFLKVNSFNMGKYLVIKTVKPRISFKSGISSEPGVKIPV